MTTEAELPTFYVNVATWDGPTDLPADWRIANAPRPLSGERMWTGECRFGTFYAAGPLERFAGGRWGWQADDARLVEFIDNDEIERRVLAYLREHWNYDSLEEAGVGMDDVAPYMKPPLPWVSPA
jgi:hypothetical protein